MNLGYWLLCLYAIVLPGHVLLYWHTGAAAPVTGPLPPDAWRTAGIVAALVALGVVVVRLRGDAPRNVAFQSLALAGLILSLLPFVGLPVRAFVWLYLLVYYYRFPGGPNRLEQ